MQRTPYFVIAIDKHLKTLKPTVADSTVVHFFDNAADIPHGGSAGNWQLATGNRQPATGNWQLATGNWQRKNPYGETVSVNTNGNCRLTSVVRRTSGHTSMHR